MQDSHLIDMLKMLKEGYSKRTKQDRINYGIQLRSAIEEFAEDFLPHMKEEEEVSRWAGVEPGDDSIYPNWGLKLKLTD